MRDKKNRLPLFFCKKLTWTTLGCAFTMQDPTPFAEQAQQSIDINYYGTKHMVETFLPLCNRNASFIGVSSTSGQLEGDTSKFATDKFPFYDHF